MTLAADRDATGRGFSIEVISTGVYGSGYGQLDDGRSFSFRTLRELLVVEIYRPRLSGPVPHAEDVVAVASRTLTDIDLTDERSIAAAVRDAVTSAQPVPRTASRPTR